MSDFLQSIHEPCNADHLSVPDGRVTRNCVFRSLSWTRFDWLIGVQVGPTHIDHISKCRNVYVGLINFLKVFFSSQIYNGVCGFLTRTLLSLVYFLLFWVFIQIISNFVIKNLIIINDTRFVNLIELNRDFCNVFYMTLISTKSLFFCRRVSPIYRRTVSVSPIYQFCSVQGLRHLYYSYDVTCLSLYFLIDFYI